MPIRRRPGAADAEEAPLGVAAVARRLGVATGTLRTWDRRYGLGPSEHISGTRRRYTPVDLSRLGVMRRLMLQGVAASEAAAVAVATRDRDLPQVSELPAAQRIPGRRARPGGGRVVATRDAGPLARDLARAAMSLDSDACAALLRDSVGRSGVVVTWNDLLVPVLTGVGDRWRSTGAGVEVEHLLTETAETVLRGVLPGAPPRNDRPVLLAALEPEEHRLPLVALAAALGERSVGTRLLGARLPARALADAVSRTGALAVFLWAHGPGAGGSHRWPGGSGAGTVDAAAAAAVVGGARPRPVLLLGGPGWNVRFDQPGVSVTTDLESAVIALASLSTGGPV
jgi:DNA-binding transcriptional MerR regulator